MRLSAAHQAAVDIKNHAQRECLAYHHALVAKLDGSITRVGSVYDHGDSYVWLMAFSPRMRDAVIVETFTSNHGDKSTHVYWLADIRRHDTDSQLGQKFAILYDKAMEMQRTEYAVAA